MTVADAAVDALDELEQALELEHRALLDHDVEGLLAATQHKLEILRVLESDPPPASERERLSALGQRNNANGVLLSRRRREVSWALRALGRSENAGSYDPLGRMVPSVQTRSFGAG